MTSPQVASQLSPSGHGCTLTSALPDCFGGDNFVLLLVCAVPFYTSFQTTVETLNFVTSGKGTHLCDMFVDERQREREREKSKREKRERTSLCRICRLDVVAQKNTVLTSAIPPPVCPVPCVFCPATRLSTKPRSNIQPSAAVLMSTISGLKDELVRARGGP